MTVRVAPLDEDPVTAARLTRDKLGLPLDTPIPHLIRALERGGVFVLALPLALDGTELRAEDTEAFSEWAGPRLERPVIAYTAGKPGDRLRLSVAHELGHLVLHSNLRGTQASMEKEAFEFAGEFLMPESALRDEILPPITLMTMAQLKRRWGVSLQALVRRAKALEIITDRQYRYFFEQISLKGWRKQEPANLAIPIESPRALTKMAEVLYGRPVDLRRMATDAGLSLQVLRDILAVNVVDERPMTGNDETPDGGKVVELLRRKVAAPDARGPSTA
jgi:Zn-dependent peptidase ImmA (M78 family)